MARNEIVRAGMAEQSPENSRAAPHEQAIERAESAERSALLCEQRERSAVAAAALAEDERLRLLQQTEVVRTRCRELQQSSQEAERQAAARAEKGAERRQEHWGSFDIQLAKLEEQAGASDAEVAVMVTDNADFEKKLQSFEALQVELAERAGVEGRQAELQMKVWRAQISEAEARLLIVIQEAPSKQADIQHLEARIAARKRQLGMYQEKMAGLDEMVATSDEVVTSMHEQIAEYDERSVALEGEAKRLFDEAAAARSKAAAARERADHAQSAAMMATVQRDAIAADVRQLQAARAKAGCSGGGVIGVIS